MSAEGVFRFFKTSHTKDRERPALRAISDWNPRSLLAIGVHYTPQPERSRGFCSPKESRHGDESCYQLRYGLHN